MPQSATARSGLPSQRQARSDIARLLRQRVAGDAPFGMIAFGLANSPQLLRLDPEFAQQLRHGIGEAARACLRPQDRLYLLGPWEWLCVLPSMIGVPALPLAMLRLRGTIEAWYAANGIEQIPVPDCGASCWPDDGSDAGYLIQSARIALLASLAGQGPMARYRPAMEQHEPSLIRHDQQLQAALANNHGIALFLQPQVDLRTGHCYGAEALLRLHAGDGTCLPPHRVLESVARLGLRPAFNRWLFQHAAQIQASLREQGIDIALSVNLGASDLLDIELPDLLEQILATRDIVPASLVLEITETNLVEESLPVTEVMLRLQALGLALSIDDFGTGYSGLGYLQRLPVQEVKIDQSFIRQADVAGAPREIIASVSQLAGRLGKRVVAEGIESEAIKQAVLELGCHCGQGYLFSPPLALADFIGWWQRHQA